MKDKTMVKGKGDECVNNRHSGLSGIGCYCNALEKKDSRQAGMTNNVIMHSVSVVFMLLPLFAISLPLAALAVSYPVQLYHQQERHDKFVQGETAYLFHSGTDEVKKAVHVNSILSVYRISPACEVQEAGKIRVISYIGENYLKAEVIEGEIRPDDVAKKGKVSFIVISAGACGH